MDIIIVSHLEPILPMHDLLTYSCARSLSTMTYRAAPGEWDGWYSGVAIGGPKSVLDKLYMFFLGGPAKTFYEHHRKCPSWNPLQTYVILHQCDPSPLVRDRACEMI